MHEIILVGNPNSGKTTLFNTLTKSFEKVSNWHGVTVGVVSKEMKLDHEKIILTDIPGIYSLDGFSSEERIACDYLKKHRSALVVNVCDANNMERGLRLTNDLLMCGYNVIVAVNMFGEACLFDYDKMAVDYGVGFVEIDARSKQGVFNLKLAIIDNFQYKKLQKYNKINTKQSNYYDFINKYKNSGVENPYNKSDKIDRIILNKYLFIFIFISCLFFIFYITFGAIGGGFSAIINNIFNKIANILRKIILCTNINNNIKTLLCDGVINSFLSVVSFVPQIALLMFFFNLLEEIGLMSRFAFMLDGLLKKVGLTGKSLFSLFLGSGCTTTAVLTTRNLENLNLRKRTALLVSFVPCSAKLPVFLVVVSLFFERQKYLYVFLLYMFSIVLLLIYALILKLVMPSVNDVFVLEMPKYRLPKFTKLLKDVFVVVKNFVFKVGFLVLLFGVIIWLLQNFSLSLKFLNGDNFEESILYNISKFLAPVFKPIGLGGVGIVCALLLGFFAKELIVVGFVIINEVSASGVALTQSLISASSVCSFTKVTSVVFLVFILIYSPCVSAIASIKNELGLKTAYFVAVFQFVLAYCVSFITNLILTNFNIFNILLVLIVIAIMWLFVLKLKRKTKTCRGNCCDCRKI